MRPDRNPVRQFRRGDAAAAFLHDQPQQAEVSVVRLFGRQDLVRGFRDQVEHDARGIARFPEIRGADQFGAIEGDEFRLLLLAVVQPRDGQALEGDSELVLRPPHAAGHAAQLAPVAREEADDEIGLPVRIAPQDDGLALSGRHGRGGFLAETRGRWRRTAGARPLAIYIGYPALGHRLRSSAPGTAAVRLALAIDNFMGAQASWTSAGTPAEERDDNALFR